VKAVVFHDVGDIRLDGVEDSKIQEPTDAIVRLTSSAICGADLIYPGYVGRDGAGHNPRARGRGVVEEASSQIRNLNVGDRVVIPLTIGCVYETFDRREPGWIKVELNPAA
jgi:threonine dehydrogenase-like Zn-dependent dehydrogenase